MSEVEVRSSNACASAPHAGDIRSGGASASDAGAAYRVSDDAAKVWADIVRLGLEPHIAELATRGYTIVPPEKAAPAGFADRLREVILDVVERRAGFRPNLANGVEFQDPAVPFGQNYGRHPEPGEALAERVAVEAPAGSLAFWHGHTWHGAFPRRTPGARLNLINAFMRMYMRPQEPYRENVTLEILARNPPRFAKLVGQHVAYGWKEEGPNYKRLGAFEGRAEHLWD